MGILMRSLWKCETVKGINQNIQDCYSKVLLVPLAPRNAFLAWEKAAGVEVRSKDDSHGIFPLFSLERGQRMAQIPLRLDLESSNPFEKQHKRD